MLTADIRALTSQADVVLVSIDIWGIHFVPAAIADYQRQVGARAAIDAGADLILGHHAHILKGFEVYRGVPILYSLGNFAMDLPMTREHADVRASRRSRSSTQTGFRISKAPTTSPSTHVRASS